MTIRARYRDWEFEVETVEEIQTLFRATRTPMETLVDLAVGRDFSTAVSRTSTETLSQKMDRLCARVKENGRRFLIELARNPKGLTDTQLRKALGFDTNLTLSGVVSGVSKAATAVHVKYDQVIVFERLKDRNDANYRYQLTADMLEAVLKQGWALEPESKPVPLSQNSHSMEVTDSDGERHVLTSR